VDQNFETMDGIFKSDFNKTVSPIPQLMADNLSLVLKKVFVFLT
jgi:hypothetical protein